MVSPWPHMGEELRVMRVKRRMAGWRGIAMVLAMVAMAYPGGAGAVDDATPYLPPGASMVQTVSLDADGDGTPDTVVLYTRRIESSQRGWLNAVVVRGDPAASATLTLFDPPGRDQPNGEPVIDLAASGEVMIRDLSEGSQPGLALSGPDSLNGKQRELWVFHWDGQRLQPVFDAASVQPGAELRDLDGDGLLEIVTHHAGVCAGADGGPPFAFVFRWRDGRYRASSADFPSVQDGFFAEANAVLDGIRAADLSRGAPLVACVHHMLALAHAYQGHGAEARTAYQQYLMSRPGPRDLPGFYVMSVPGHVSEPYFREDIEHLLARIEAGQLGAWEPSERAVLHDLVGNALEDRGRDDQFEAEQMWRSGQRDQYDAIMATGQETLDRAAEEYRAALALDPDDAEAQAGLTRIRR